MVTQNINSGIPPHREQKHQFHKEKYRHNMNTKIMLNKTSTKLQQGHQPIDFLEREKCIQKCEQRHPKTHYRKKQQCSRIHRIIELILEVDIIYNILFQQG
jgi:hypothetical protein